MTCADCGSPCQGRYCRDCERERGFTEPGETVAEQEARADGGLSEFGANAAQSQEGTEDD